MQQGQEAVLHRLKYPTFPVKSGVVIHQSSQDTELLLHIQTHGNMLCKHFLKSYLCCLQFSI